MVLASGRIGREGCGYATITGQANGQGGREHGQKCDQLPGARDIENPEHRAHVAGVWGVDPDDLPRAGRRRLRDLPQDRPRRDPRPAEHLLQPAGLAAGQRLHRADAGEARVLRRDRLLPERDRPVRRRRAARLAPRGGRGDRHQRRGPGHQDQQGGRLPRRGPAGLADHPGHRRGAGPPARLHLRRAARDLRRAAAGVRRRRRRLLGHHLREDRAAVRRLLALPERRPPRHAPPVRAGLVEPGRARATGRSTSPTARPASTSPPTRRRPRTWTRSTR